MPSTSSQRCYKIISPKAAKFRPTPRPKLPPPSFAARATHSSLHLHMHLHVLLLLGIIIILGHNDGNARAVLTRPSIASTNDVLAETPRILNRRNDKFSPDDPFKDGRLILKIKAEQGKILTQASEDIAAAQGHLQSNNPKLSPEKAQKIRLKAFGTYVEAMTGVFKETDNSGLSPKRAKLVRTGLLDNFRWPATLHEPLPK